MRPGPGSLYRQVKLSWFNGRRLTVAMSSTIKQLNINCLRLIAYFNNYCGIARLLLAIARRFLCIIAANSIHYCQAFNLYSIHYSQNA